MKSDFYCFRCDRYFKALQIAGSSNCVICKNCMRGDHVVRADHPTVQLKDKDFGDDENKNE